MAARVSRFWLDTITDAGRRFNEIGGVYMKAEQLVAIPYEFRYTIVIGNQESIPC